MVAERTGSAGVGIVGKEGKQASLAADFSINQFSHLTKLLLWHGRNSYKRSAKLAQFVIHRGLIISTIQAVFSAIFFFARESLAGNGAQSHRHPITNAVIMTCSHRSIPRLAASRLCHPLYHGSGLFTRPRPRRQRRLGHLIPRALQRAH